MVEPKLPPERIREIPNWWPRPTTFSDVIRATIALIVILGGAWFIHYAWATPQLTAPGGSTYLDRTLLITPAFGLITSVMGYYFGSKGTDAAIKKAADAEADKKAVVNHVDKELKARHDKIDDPDVKAHLESLRESITSEFGS
ncbi:MAG: hypothetical protein QOE90_2776 [Thermoplasmata archaeon]|jgi:hypothetical protein|nr:hypothetical protein [Thermoplasmata archaeon]